jgi:flagellar hook-basal body complex protein FliE
MTDPLGLIGNTGGVGRSYGGSPLRPSTHDGPSFKEALLEQIGKVDALQKKADQAITELSTGERDDVEGVMLATLEADTAFRMLLQVRNKVMDAYEEVKQIRV